MSLLLWPFKLVWKIIKFFAYLIGSLILFVSLFFLLLPNIASLRKNIPTTTSFMEQYKEDLEDKGQEPAIDYRWVPFSQISSNLKKAVLVSEDDAFYQHNGFDWRQIQESLKLNWKKKTLKRGGSTITQQLVKNLYLSPSKSFFRKIRETILTYQMEKTLTKDRIFEIYLNVVEWGPGVYGAEAAAKYYYGSSAKSLSASQAAYLAAILPNPKVYGANKSNKKVRWKANWIMKRMGAAPTPQNDNPPVSNDEEPPALEENTDNGILDF